MADTPTRPDEVQQSDARGRDDRFHYYSGGEVKELADTHISAVYWWTVGILIVGAVLYLLFGGALGPRWKFGGYQPVGGSRSHLDAIQSQLDTRASGLSYASVDLTQLPVPQGQNIGQAIDKGSQVYQTYCIGCHGPNQDGNGVNAATLNPKPRNLRDAPFVQAMSYQRINTSIHKGVPGTAMPRWENTLTETEIKDVIAYVFSLTSPTPATTGQGQSTGQAGGTKSYVGGSQNSPKPITPAVGGNPTAATTTAPPSMSGAPVPTGPATGVSTGPATGGPNGTPATPGKPSGVGPSPEAAQNMMNPSTRPGLGSENVGPKPQPTSPMAGGRSAGSLIHAPTPPSTSTGPVKPGNQQMATSPANAPKPGAPVPGSPTSQVTGRSKPANGGSGM